MAKIAFEVRGIEPLKQYLDGVRRGIRGFVTQEIANVLMEDYLRPYPPYRYASRKMAYGKTFFSKAQRAYVMSRIRAGIIRPGVENRSNNLADAWRVTGDGVNAKISVDEDKAKYAKYVVGDAQAAQPYHAGWVKAKYVIDQNMQAATQKAQKAVDRWVKETPGARPT